MLSKVPTRNSQTRYIYIGFKRLIEEIRILIIIDYINSYDRVYAVKPDQSDG